MKANSQFPDYLVCRGILGPDGHSAVLRYKLHNDDAGVVFTTSLNDISWVSRPAPMLRQIGSTRSTTIEEAFRALFERYGLTLKVKKPDKGMVDQAIRLLFDQPGTALVACRVLPERQGDYAVVVVPAISGPSRFAVSPENLAEKR